MHAYRRCRHQKRGVVLQLSQKTLHEIGGKEGGIGGDGDYLTGAGRVHLSPFTSRMDAGKGSGKASHAVSDDRKVKVRKARGLAIGIDDKIGDLRLQPLDDVGEDRAAAERLQPFVAAAHPARSAAGKQDADNAFGQSILDCTARGQAPSRSDWAPARAALSHAPARP